MRYGLFGDEISGVYSDSMNYVQALHHDDVAVLKQQLARHDDLKHKLPNHGIRSVEMMQAILDFGMSPFERVSYGRTLLFGAAIGGNTDVVDFVLRLGAEVNVTDISGITPLIEAVKNKHYKVAEMLVKAGADPKAFTNSLNTVEDYVADKKKYQELLAHAPGILQVPSLAWDNTPRVFPYIFKKKIAVLEYFKAAAEGDANNVVRLLKKGLNPNVQNEDQRSVFSVITDRKTALAVLSARFNARVLNGHGELIFAETLPENRYDVMDVLLDTAAVDINGTDRLQRTALMKATEANSYKAIKMLVDAGADVSMKDCDGKRAIDYLNYDTMYVPPTLSVQKKVQRLLKPLKR